MTRRTLPLALLAACALACGRTVTAPPNTCRTVDTLFVRGDTVVTLTVYRSGTNCP